MDSHGGRTEHETYRDRARTDGGSVHVVLGIVDRHDAGGRRRITDEPDDAKPGDRNPDPHRPRTTKLKVKDKLC